MKVLFRVEGGARVGLGHLQRCLSLAAAFQRQGEESFFLFRADAQMAARVDRWGFERSFLGEWDPWGKEDLDETIALARVRGPGIVVVDSDDEGADYTRGLREAGLFVCALEDIAPHPFPCQVVVNGDAHAAELSYQPEREGGTDFFLGTRYAILRPEFWGVTSRPPRGPVQRILVTAGGADPLEQTAGILGLLGSLRGDFAVSVIIGPFFANRPALWEAARLFPGNVRLVDDPAEMRPWMEEADLAVSAAGQTLYELACVGCPTIAFSVASNQEGQLAALSRAGCVREAGDARKGDVLPAIREHLMELIPDAAGRAEMTRAGQQQVDGQGALRVAGLLARRFTQAGGGTVREMENSRG